MTNRELGEWGEAQAQQYFEDQGFKLAEKNYRTPYGEIDLILVKGDRYHFVEVKTRRSEGFGFPEEAITSQKLVHMEESAEYYMLVENQSSSDWQIDVCAISFLASKTPTIKYFENVSA